MGQLLVLGDGRRLLLAAAIDSDHWISSFEEMSPHDVFEIDKRRKAEAEQKARDEQVAVNAYHRLFKSEDGQIVLSDLDRAFRMSQPAFEQSTSYNPIAAAIRDGERGILLYIFKQLKRPCQGDANIEVKPKVIK